MDAVNGAIATIQSVPTIFKAFKDDDYCKGIGTSLASVGSLAVTVSPFFGPAGPVVAAVGGVVALAGSCLNLFAKEAPDPLKAISQQIKNLDKSL